MAELTDAEVVASIRRLLPTLESLAALPPRIPTDWNKVFDNVFKAFASLSLLVLGYFTATGKEVSKEAKVQSETNSAQIAAVHDIGKETEKKVEKVVVDSGIIAKMAAPKDSAKE